MQFSFLPPVSHCDISVDPEDGYTVTIHRDDLSCELGAILLPRVKVARADHTSVYWEDTLGAVWGVRFLTEGDTLRFLAGCSPPVLTPNRYHDSANVRWVPPLPLEEELSDSSAEADILRTKQVSFNDIFKVYNKKDDMVQEY